MAELFIATDHHRVQNTKIPVCSVGEIFWDEIYIRVPVYMHKNDESNESKRYYGDQRNSKTNSTRSKTTTPVINGKDATLFQCLLLDL
jgi:hypothetical protein